MKMMENDRASGAENRGAPDHRFPGPGLAAFTLVELLVVMAILLVLAGIVMAGVKSVTETANQTKEVQAGRTLIAAYSAAAADHDGAFLPGYDRTVTEVNLPDGTSLSGPPAERYTYRLAPYFQYRMDSAVLVGKNAKEIDPQNRYLVSCYPAFGINYLFVGGDISAAGVMTYPSECITRQGASLSIIAFASAVGDSQPSKINGYCILTPPQTTGAMWNPAPWSADSLASEYGNVDARYSGKAICVFLDGSVRLLGIEELRDMRLWNLNARQDDNSRYTIYQAPPPPRGR